MKLFFSKKAAHDFFSMFWEKLLNLFVAFVFIFIPLITYVSLVTDSDFFERNYLSIDLALTNEALLSSPNDVVYFYDKNLKDFSISIDDKKIEIKRSISSGTSYYINNPSININYGEISPLTETINKKKKIVPIELNIFNIDKNIVYTNQKESLLNN